MSNEVHFLADFSYLPFESESEVAQSCPTLCDPVDSSPPGSSVHGILQARILEWVAFPSPGDLPDPGIEARSPALQADALTSEPHLVEDKEIITSATRQRCSMSRAAGVLQSKRGRTEQVCDVYHSPWFH